MDDFIVPDDSDEDAIVPKKRKRQQAKASKSVTPPRSSPPESKEDDEADEDVTMTGTSTAQQWTYDPDNLEPLNPRPATQPVKKNQKTKQRPSATEPEGR